MLKKNKTQLFAIAFLFGFAIAGFFLISFNAYNNALTIVKDQFREQQDLVVKQTAANIEINLGSIVEELEFLSNWPETRDMDSDKVKILMLKLFEHLQGLQANDLGLLNDQGIVVATVNADHLIGKDFSFRQYFKQAKTFTKPAPAYDFITFQGADLGKKGIVIAMPVFTPAHEFGGVLLCTVLASKLVKSFIPQDTRQAEFWVIDSNGNIIYHPKYEPGPLHQSMRGLEVSFRNFLIESANKKNHEAEYIAQDGTRRLATSHAMQVAGQIWWLISSTPEEVITRSMAPFSMKYLLSVAIIFLTIISASLVIFFIVYRYSDELQATNKKLENEIFDRQQAETALRESEKKYRSLYSSMNEGAALHEIIYNESGKAVDYRIIDINSSYESITGLKRDAALGRKGLELYGKEAAPYLDIYARVSDSGRPSSFETYFQPMDKYFSISVSSPRQGQFATVFTDITERRRMEDELARHQSQLEELIKERTAELIKANRQLRDEISSRKKAMEKAAVMEERGRLARELHDSVTQSLYSLTLFAETGKQLTIDGDMDRLRDCLDELKNNAQETLKEMRLLVYDLRPTALEEEGLKGALQKRLETVERRSGVKGSLIIEGDGKLSVLEEGAIYRMAQEALNNALKHSSATEVSVRISTYGDTMEMWVIDNGSGFDMNSVQSKGGLGLISMRERAEKLGGTMTIRTSPNEGTEVKVMISRYNLEEE